MVIIYCNSKRNVYVLMTGKSLETFLIEPKPELYVHLR